MTTDNHSKKPVKNVAAIFYSLAAVSAINVFLRFSGSLIGFFSITVPTAVFKLFEFCKSMPDGVTAALGAGLALSVCIAALGYFAARSKAVLQMAVILYIADAVLSMRDRAFFVLLCHIVWIVPMLNGLRGHSNQTGGSQVKGIRGWSDYGFLLKLKTSVGYPLFTSVIVFVLAFPVVMIKRTLMGFPPFEVMVVFFAFQGAVMMFALFGSIWILGYASGYRPYVFAWKNLSASDAHNLFLKIMERAVSLGFEPLVHEKGLIIAVNGHLPGAESKEKESMQRLVVRLTGTQEKSECSLELANHNFVVWDTGERGRCKNTGQSLVEDVNRT